MKKHVYTARYIKADDELDADASAISDTIDDINDTVENLQDTIEDDYPEDTYIDMNNNIADHFIAECDRCHNTFISPVIFSEQNKLTSTKGECPICHNETEQSLKWVIKTVETLDEVDDIIEIREEQLKEEAEEEKETEDVEESEEESEEKSEKTYEF